jgi:hypothetical protein
MISVSSIVYATFKLVRESASIARMEKKYSYYRQQTLIDISSTCKDLKNADNERDYTSALRELKGLHEFVKTYY